MKKHPLILAALGAAISTSAFGQTAYTTPVGYISLGNSAASADNVAANTDVVISVPVLKSPVYMGLVATVTATTVSIAGTPAFGVNAWTAIPHVLVVESGPNSGLIVPVSSNTADTLTVAPGVFTLTGIVASNKVSIRPAWTISTLMAGASSVAGVQLFTFSNTQLNINNSANSLYFSVGGGNWENSDGASANNVILYPGEGFIVRTAATPIADFVISGEVPMCNSYLAIGQKSGGARDTFLSYVSPVSETLGTAGIGISSGDILIDFNNTISGRNKSGTSYFYIGGGNWEDSDGGSANGFKLEGGKAYVFRRSSAAASNYVISKDTQTYIPSL